MSPGLVVVGVLALWWLAGFSGHMFWWIRRYDYEGMDAAVGCLWGLFGPFAWLLGAPTLIRRRG